MKPIVLPYILLGLFASCQQKPVRFELATIQTPTLVCGTCAKTIEKAIYRVEGVNEVKVDVDKRIVQVKYAPLQTNVEYLESSIAAAGYDANTKQRDPDAYAQLDACCKVDRQ